MDRFGQEVKRPRFRETRSQYADRGDNVASDHAMLGSFRWLVRRG